MTGDKSSGEGYLLLFSSCFVPLLRFANMLFKVTNFLQFKLDDIIYLFHKLLGISLLYLAIVEGQLIQGHDLH